MTSTRWASSDPLGTPQSPVGASLLAKAAWQSTSMLNVLASSRAGSLPHWFFVCLKTPYQRTP
ncbi:hypothetical protein FJD35_30110 [Pseudomonas mandelii]|nr:hypothetical protein FJD35_30110 [Pseudomonas mandelii]